MRAKEFINEASKKIGKHHDHHASVHKGISVDRDPGGWYPSYHQMRTGMALAQADGKNSPINVDSESWMGPFWTQHPYTKEEYDMFAQVRKHIPTEHYQRLPWSDSKEPDDTSKQSPVAKPKKNKHGI
jgi:hypothetical protein